VFIVSKHKKGFGIINIFILRIEKFFSSGIGLGVFTVAINIDDTLLAPSSK